MTEVSAVTCPKCKATVFSRARHDFRSCPCEYVSIDGGFDYIKVSFAGDTPPKYFMLEIEQTQDELYHDWNHHEDRYGILLEEISPERIVPPKETPLLEETEVEMVDVAGVVEVLTVGQLEGILSKVENKATPVYFSTDSGYVSEQLEVSFQLADVRIPFQDGVTEDCIIIIAKDV